MLAEIRAGGRAYLVNTDRLLWAGPDMSTPDVLVRFQFPDCHLSLRLTPEEWERARAQLGR